MNEINSLREAEMLVSSLLTERSACVVKLESGIKPGNSVLHTNMGDLFHVKFTKKPFRPDSDKKGAARELHLKLQFAINTFRVF